MSTPGEMLLEQPSEGILKVILSGRWKLQRDLPGADGVVRRLGEMSTVRSVGIDAKRVDEWDSGLLVFLWELRKFCLEKEIRLHSKGLPRGVSSLLELTTAVPESKEARKSKGRVTFISNLGDQTIDFFTSCGDLLEFVGEATVAFLRLLRGKARYRSVDLWLILESCSGQALPIITLITVKDLTMAYGDFVVMNNLSFNINRGDIFIIMGGSGCGKSTLMTILIGLKSPARGQVFYDGVDFWGSDQETRDRVIRGAGVMYQSGALWSSMTLAENVALPLETYTDLTPGKIYEVVKLKLALVGLAGFEGFYPSEISGGMQKRADIARAMAMDPEILFFDVPSAGLDPVSARRLDEIILQLSEILRTTMVVVTHELASIFKIGNNSVFLDASQRTMTATGDPNMLLAETEDPALRLFLTRGEQSQP